MFLWGSPHPCGAWAAHLANAWDGLRVLVAPVRFAPSLSPFPCGWLRGKATNQFDGSRVWEGSSREIGLGQFGVSWHPGRQRLKSLAPTAPCRWLGKGEARVSIGFAGTCSRKVFNYILIHGGLLRVGKGLEIRPLNNWPPWGFGLGCVMVVSIGNRRVRWKWRENGVIKFQHGQATMT